MLWEGTAVPMKEMGTMSSKSTTQDLYEYSIESAIIKEAEKRHKEILDVDYSPIQIKSYVASMSQVNTKQKEKLI